ncbi:transposon TX1 [Tanacetum coccineum]
MRASEKTGHIGSRWKYNGNALGPNFTSGNRNSSTSFMFFNFSEDWGMGKLWMEFKKYGVVFDMFMAQKRLRNGQRYGFVCFKNIKDVEDLYKRLCNIRIGRELLKVFFAHDRRRDDGGVEGRNTRMGYSIRKSNITKGGRWDGQPEAQEAGRGDGKNKEEVVRRTVEVRNDEVDTEILDRKEGLINVDVKLLGGMEVMLVFDTPKIASNIPCDLKHGLRRWIHKVRRWNVNYSPKGRITWINIMGVSVTCWTSSVFRRIFEWNETILSMSNCSLNGNQNVTVGKVQLHTTVAGLINESLLIKCKGRTFKVNITEDVKDVLDVKIKELMVNMNEHGGGVESEEEGEAEDEDDEDGGENFSADIVVDNCGGHGNNSNIGIGPELSVRDNMNVPRVVKINETHHNDDGPSFVQVVVNNAQDNNNKDTEEGDQRGIKRDDAPPNYNSSGGVRCTKKRKTTANEEFEGTNNVNRFSQGVMDESDKSCRRAGRRTMNLAKKEARQKRSQGKYGVADDLDGCFSDNATSDVNWDPTVNRNNNVTCNITEEQIREISEQIGINWDLIDDRRVSVEGIGVKGGIEDDGKKGWLKSIINEERPNIIGLQETKSGGVDNLWVKEVWGSRGFGYTQFSAKGMSGGLLLIWDANIFICREAIGDERFAAIKGNWKGKVAMSIWCTSMVLMTPDDRLNSQVNLKEMDDFNDFVNAAWLIEVPMGGRKFTRVKERDIRQVVAGAWEKEVRSCRPDCRFRDKLKNVKIKVKIWSRKRFGAISEKIEDHRKEAMRNMWIEKENVKVSMLRQKSRVRWDVEGDFNEHKPSDESFILSIMLQDLVTKVSGYSGLVDLCCGYWDEVMLMMLLMMDVVNVDVVDVVKMWWV